MEVGLLAPSGVHISWHHCAQFNTWVNTWAFIYWVTIKVVPKGKFAVHLWEVQVNGEKKQNL